MADSIVPFTREPTFITLQSLVPVGRISDPVGFLCFTLGEEEYGVDLKLVSQVVKPPPVTWVPRLPGHFLGIVSIRGAVVTLVDLRQLMGLDTTAWPRTARILIVEIAEEQIGLLVDSVTQVRRVKPAQLEKKPYLREEIAADYVICVARPEENKPVLIVDLDSILQEKLK
jgi:purine-binding chemotaxis protein CheW